MPLNNKPNYHKPDEVIMTVGEFDALQKNDDALKTLDARLRHIFNTLDNSFWGVDIVNSKMLYVSPGNEKVYGYTEEEFLSNPNLWYQVIVDEDKPVGDSLFPIVRAGEKAIAEYRINHKNGSVRWVEARLTPTLDKDGNLILLDGITFDITERKNAEQKLLERKARFKNLVESVKGVYWVNDPVNKRTKYISPSYETIWGRPCKEIYRDPSSFIQSVHPDDKAGLFQAYERVEDFTNTDIEYRIIRPDGEVRWISAKISVSTDETGNKTEYGYAEDITERKRAEELLAQREWSLNEAQRLSKTGSFEFNLETNELLWSKEHYRIFELEEIAPDQLWEECRKKIHPDDIAKLDDAINSAKTLGKPVNLEHRIICNDGTVKHLYGIAGLYKDKNGKGHILRGSVQDVTELKKSEQQLRQSEYHLRAVVLAEPECVKVVDKQGRLVEINPAGLEILEADTAEQVLNKEVIYHVLPEHHQAFNALSKAVFSGKSGRLEFEITGLKGTRRWLETSAVPLRNDNGEIYALLSVTRDISERKRAENELKLNQKRLLEAQRVAKMGDYSYDFATGIWKCSEVLDEITGLDAKAIMVFDNWINLITPDYKEEIINKITPLIQGGTMPSGHYLDCKIKRAGDGEERWVSIVGEIDYDVNGKPLRLKGTVQDITERKNAEQEIQRLNESLERKVEERTAELQIANKELEAFNYSVSHDLQNPLRSLSGFSSILVNDYSDKLDELGKEYLHLINQSAIRMSELVNELLQLSKLGKSSSLIKRNVDMKKLVDMVIKDQQRQPKDIKTQFKVENLPAASGDYALLRQVWENLISNAIKYSSKKEEPVVSIGAKELKGEVLYFIKDNGAGFDMENADKLFKVFSRMHTNDEFEGNGVGLAIVERIVSKHGGRIWAESESGRGSVFHFTLPMQ